MNWGEIKAAVRTGAWRTDTPLDVVERYAKQALREIMELRDWHWLRAETSFTTSAATHTPPADFGVPEALFLQDSPSDFLYPLTFYSLTQLRQRWDLSETGEPVDYTYELGELHFGPAPDKAETFRLIYRVSDDPALDTFTNHVTTTYPQLLIDLAAGKLLQSYYLDPEAASSLFKSYEYSLSQAESADDRKGYDDLTGMVQPDNALYLAAHPSGRGGWFGR